MTRASKLLNLPIISASNGQKLEKARDILYDDKNDFIKAFLVDEGGWLRTAKIVPYSSVTSIGEDAIIVKDENAIVTADMVNGIDTDPKNHVSIRDKAIMTENGKNLGKIIDLEIDEQTGKVKYYVATGGVFQDLYKGHMHIESSKMRKVGEDVVFVDNSTVDNLEKHSKGIKGAMEKVGEKIEDTSKNLGHKAQNAVDNVKEKTKDVANDFKSKANSTNTREAMQDIKERVEAGWEKLKHETQKGIHNIDEATAPNTTNNTILPTK